jgi:hypothetical protein
MLAFPAMDAHCPELSRKEMLQCGSTFSSSVLWDSVLVKKSRSVPPASYMPVNIVEICEGEKAYYFGGHCHAPRHKLAADITGGHHAIFAAGGEFVEGLKLFLDCWLIEVDRLVGVSRLGPIG